VPACGTGSPGQASIRRPAGRSDANLTIYGQVRTFLVMIETNTSQFKARLGQFMRAVREGAEVIIKDRDEPVARLVPFEARGQGEERLLCSRKSPSAPPLGQVRVRPVRYRGASSTELLRSDRDRR
jgi:prevent-host-death family protein